MGSDLTQEKKIFFNQQFDKKRLKALISWVFKQSGEAKALRVVDLLKETGFKHATKAGISIGLHDLTTPIQKSWLISESQLSIATTQRDFIGARITATERSQRIVDTWHRASESLSKQVVDYFAVYDRFNPVYIMALSGARGNFSQVRQLVGMRGLMADQQGKIVSFPIRSNLREGLTLTEYFISCSGARKGLVDTALRTADTGYLTRRLVDVSHHVIVKRIRCNTNRGIAFTSLQSYNKVLLPLKERLVGRVLAEDIFLKNEEAFLSSYFPTDSNFAEERGTTGTSYTSYLDTDESSPNKSAICKHLRVAYKYVQSSASQHVGLQSKPPLKGFSATELPSPEQIYDLQGATKQSFVRKKFWTSNKASLCKKLCKGLQSEALFAHQLPVQNTALERGSLADKASYNKQGKIKEKKEAVIKRDQEISLKLALKIAKIRDKVELRSPLTCGFTHGVCQLCYGWSISQGSLVSLGDAVGVIAAQSIGEPGTQLTMRTFHTGGVFSGDLLQEIRAPHTGRVEFSKAFQGLLIRTAHGRIAFLSKIEGSLVLSDDTSDRGPFESKTSEQSTVLFFGGTKGSPSLEKNKKEKKESKNKSKRSTTILIPAFTMLFVRQGEQVENNQLLAEFSIRTKEGNQPIKTQQTVFSELSGRVVEDCSGKDYTRSIKDPSLLLDSLERSKPILEKRVNSCPYKTKFCSNKAEALYAPYKSKICMGCTGVAPLREACSASQHQVAFATRKLEAKLLPKPPSPYKYKASHTYKTSYKAKLCTCMQSFVRKKICMGQVSLPPSLSPNHALLACKASNPSYKTLFCTELLPYKYKALHISTKLRFVRSFVRMRSFVLVRARRRGDALSRLHLQSTDLSLRQNRGLNVPHNVQKKTLQKIVDKGLRTQGISGFRYAKVRSEASSKRPVFLNRSSSQSIKKKQSVVCKAQPLSLHKGEGLENDVFKHIEPVRSGRLGFLKVLSTRVGATLDYMSPAKSFEIGFKDPLIFKSDQDAFKPRSYKCHLSQVKRKMNPPHLHAFATITSGERKLEAKLLQKEEDLFFLQARQKPSDVGTPAFCRYLHPEVVKTNRFVLQTVAEYGDVVEEGYSLKNNTHLT